MNAQRRVSEPSDAAKTSPLSVPAGVLPVAFAGGMGAHFPASMGQ
jgi:hypothetical protein